MEKIYNKLVRDKIPDIIIDNGETPHIRILNETEYRSELKKKLLEECKEAIEEKEPEELTEELADIAEVISCLAALYDKTLDDVLLKAKEKAHERGSFKKRIFLEKKTYGI